MGKYIWQPLKVNGVIMKYFNHIISILIFLSFIYSCSCLISPKAIPNKNCLPNSRKVTYISSPSSTEIICRATGNGKSFAQAYEDSKTAVIWFAINYIVKITDVNELHSEKFLCNHSPEKYIRWQSDCLKKVVIAGNTFVDYEYKIDMEMLKSEIKPPELPPEPPFQPSIAVLSSNPGNKFSPVAISVVKGFLIDRGYDVFIQTDMSKSDRISELTRKIIGQEQDPFYQMAIELGTDIYIKITQITCQRVTVSGVTTLQSSITMEALDTATDKQIGSTSEQSKQRYTPACESLVQEASQLASNKVINQISRQIKRQNDKGKAYKIVLFVSSGNAQAVNKNLYASLKLMSNSKVRILGSGSKQFSYIVCLKKILNTIELFDDISSHYAGPGKLKKEFGKGAFLILTNESGSEVL